MWKRIIYPLLKPEKKENQNFLQKNFGFLSEKTRLRGLFREKQKFFLQKKFLFLSFRVFQLRYLMGRLLFSTSLNTCMCLSF
jgi:hypothetical protein